MPTTHLGTITGLGRRFMLSINLKFSALAMLAMLLLFQADGRRIVPMKFAKHFTNQALEPFSRQRVGGISQCASLCGPTMQECAAFRLVDRGDGYKDCLLYNSVSYSLLMETADADSVTLYVTREVNYIGCFVDYQLDRDLLVEEAYADNKAENCIDVCRLKGYKYAGLQYGEWCHCGDSYGRHGQVSDSECEMQCPGDSQQSCGGQYNNSIYSTGHADCPDGYYLNPKTNRCFKCWFSSRTWASSRDRCGDYGSTLITFPTVESFDWFIQFWDMRGNEECCFKYMGMREIDGQWKWEGLTIGNVSTSDPRWQGGGHPNGLRAEDDGFGGLWLGRSKGFLDVGPGMEIGFCCERHLV